MGLVLAKDLRQKSHVSLRGQSTYLFAKTGASRALFPFARETFDVQVVIPVAWAGIMMSRGPRVP